MSRRLERVSKEIARILGNLIIHEMKDPRMGFVTITRVVVSPDLQIAKIFLSIMGDEKQQKLTLAGFRHAKGFLQREVGRRLGIRTMPELMFIHDQSIEKVIRLTKIIETQAVGRGDDAGHASADDEGEDDGSEE